MSIAEKNEKEAVKQICQYEQQFEKLETYVKQTIRRADSGIDESYINNTHEFNQGCIFELQGVLVLLSQFKKERQL